MCTYMRWYEVLTKKEAVETVSISVQQLLPTDMLLLLLLP